MQKYKYVAVIGIDGMGNFNQHTVTPCMDRIFAHAASSYYALSMDPTISAENWGGMLLGAEPSVHGLTNGYISCHTYSNDNLPSLFKRIRKEYPDAYLASVVNWNPINIGIVEEGIGVDKRTADNDSLVTDIIIDCVKKKPLFLFVQLDEVDGAGHHFGYGTKGYLDKITEIDSLIGRIYSEYENQGIADDTLFICIADHGGNNHGHGGWTEGEKYVFLAAAGRGVAQGNIGFAVTKDISAIVLYALGIDIPFYNTSGFTSQIPAGLFKDYHGSYIKPELRQQVSGKNTPVFESNDGMKYLFGDRLKLCMFFDNSDIDETGKCGVIQSGNVKYYSNGVMSDAAEFGATGSLSINSLDVSNSFSFAFWLLADADLPEQICVLGNKPLERALYQEKGFDIILRNHSVMVQLGCGDDDIDSVSSFGADGYRGWVHIAVSFDYENSVIRTFVNFGAPHTDPADRKYFESITQAGEIVIGDDSTSDYNSRRGLIFRMDDLICVDGVFSGSDIKKLEKYYN